MIKNIVGAAFASSLVLWMGYVFYPSDGCARVENATLPIKLAADVGEFAAGAWSPEKALRVRLWGLQLQLTTAQYLQQQFYYKSGGLRCAWDDVTVFKDAPAPAAQGQGAAQPNTGELDLPALPPEQKRK